MLNLSRYFLQMALSFVFFLLTGCGYQMGTGPASPPRRTLSVPYVRGDVDGHFTATLVSEVTRRTPFRYQHTGGELTLCVAVVESCLDHIGFRYDQKKREGKRDLIIPDESRLTETVEVSLIERTTGCLVLGPMLISASSEFDHDYYSSRGGINIFSLGQLSDIDVAQDSAVWALNRELARKVVDYLLHGW